MNLKIYKLSPMDQPTPLKWLSQTIIYNISETKSRSNNPKSMELRKGKMKNLVYPIVGLIWTWNRHVFHSELSHIINNAVRAIHKKINSVITLIIFFEKHIFGGPRRLIHMLVYTIKWKKNYFLLWTSFEFENANPSKPTNTI